MNGTQMAKLVDALQVMRNSLLFDLLEEWGTKGKDGSVRISKKNVQALKESFEESDFDSIPHKAHDIIIATTVVVSEIFPDGENQVAVVSDDKKRLSLADTKAKFQLK